MVVKNLKTNKMEKTKQEQIEICVEYFTKSHKNEKLMGTLVLIAMVVVSILIFPFTKILIGYFLFCFLIYFKFLYDIKRKWNNAISEFRKKADGVSG
jgi:Ca2+/Na+ antiporter